MTSPRRCLLVTVATLVVATAGIVYSAPIDVTLVHNAIRGFLVPNRDREVMFVMASADGLVWVIGCDWGWGTHAEWYGRLIGRDGSPVSDEIRLTFSEPTLRRHAVIKPMGTLPDGSLLADIDDGMFARYIGRVGLDGSTTTRYAPSYAGAPCVDRDGKMHIFTPFSYMQVLAAEPDMPTSRVVKLERDTTGGAGEMDTPRWLYDCRDGARAMYGEGKGRMVVAVRVADSLIRLYRVDTESLSILDTGSISVDRDIFRSWREFGPLGMTISPDERSGYWLFVPSAGASAGRAAAAYRFRADLSTVRPLSVQVGISRPFLHAPGRSIVSIRAPYTPPDSRHRTADREFKLRVEYTAYGSDGQLYEQVNEEVVKMRRTE